MPQAQSFDQPFPAFLASVVNVVKQALAAEQASNLTLRTPASSSTYAPAALVRIALELYLASLSRASPKQQADKSRC